MSSSGTSQALRFKEYVVSPQSRTLRKNGILIRLYGQSFEILLMLLDHPGQVVTRDELKRKLWSSDTFVDFEHGLNVAIRNLRRALNDSPEEPRYVETVPRLGYRFVAEVRLVTEEVKGPAAGETAETPLANRIVAPAVHGQSLSVSSGNNDSTLKLPRTNREMAVPSVEDTTDTTPRNSKIPRRVLLTILAICLCVASGLVTFWALAPPAVPRVTRYLRLTNDSATKIPSAGCCPPALVSDGSRVYFTEKAASTWQVAEVSAKGGEVAVIPSPYERTNNVVFAISPIQSELLISPWEGWELATPLWAQSLPGGSARRVGGLIVNDASWSPDGKSIIYGKGRELYVAKADGSESRRIATLRGIVYLPRQSPDGKIFRVTTYDVNTGRQSLWEIPADGVDPQPLFPGGDPLRDDCCGNWTSDGKYFVFQSSRDGATQIWVIRERGRFFNRRRRETVQLTMGPMEFLSPSISPDDKRLFVIGNQQRAELLRYDPASQQFVRYFSGISAQYLDFSPKGNWVAYVTYPEGVLWRSRIDGTDRLQLTDPSLRTALPSISPDRAWIAFMGAKPNGTWRIYLISADGGSPEQLPASQGTQWNPSWSPNGDFLVFGESLWSPTASIHLLDMRTRQVSTLPGSDGLFYPRWSPNGRFILATTTDSLTLLLFHVKSQAWQELAHGHWISSPTWSRNSEYVYFCDLQESATPFYRVRLIDHKLERVADVNLQQGLAGGPFGRWTGLTPDDSPLISSEVGMQDIFALDLQLP